mgnify:CR=1 FL=1
MTNKNRDLINQKTDEEQKEHLRYLTILRDQSIVALGVYMQSQNKIDESVITFQKHMVENYENQLQSFIKALKNEKE